MVSKRLRELRENAGITQKEIAEMLNVKPATISRYENGTNEPDTKTLRWYAEHFDVTLDWIFGLTNHPRTIKKDATIDGRAGIAEVNEDSEIAKSGFTSEQLEYLKKMLDDHRNSSD